MKQIFYCLTLGSVIFFTACGSSTENKETATAENAVAAASVPSAEPANTIDYSNTTAEAILKFFKNNLSLETGTSGLEGKEITLTGTVYQSGVDADGLPFVALNVTGNEDANNFACYFPKGKQNESDAKAKKAGETVKIKGVFDSKINICLMNSEFVK